MRAEKQRFRLNAQHQHNDAVGCFSTTYIHAHRIISRGVLDFCGCTRSRMPDCVSVGSRYCRCGAMAQVHGPDQRL